MCIRDRSKAQGMIGDTKYYLGGYNGSVSGQGITQTPVQMYSYERKISGSSHYQDSNPTSWTGKLALMYASDYGYAALNCESEMLYNPSSSTNDIRACNSINWLYNNNYEWLLPQSARDSSKINYYAFYITSDGLVYYYDIRYGSFTVRPVLYLISSVEITDGDGTSANPYILSADEK